VCTILTGPEFYYVTLELLDDIVEVLLGSIGLGGLGSGGDRTTLASDAPMPRRNFTPRKEELFFGRSGPLLRSETPEGNPARERGDDTGRDQRCHCGWSV